MPRFHFHTEDGVADTDRVGRELADIDAARAAAIQVLTDRLSGSPQTFWDTESFRVTVTDDTGLTLFTLQLSATLAPVLRRSREI